MRLRVRVCATEFDSNTAALTKLPSVSPSALELPFNPAYQPARKPTRSAAAPSLGRRHILHIVVTVETPKEDAIGSLGRNSTAPERLEAH